MIIIDAYNLLKQIIKSSHATEHERKIFINQIGSYAQKKQVSILLVFDGGSSPRPEHFTKDGIRIVYSGFTLSADDYIQEYIVKHTKQQMLLVSSDRGLYAVASRYRVTTIDSLAFHELLLYELAKKPAIQVTKTRAKAEKLYKEDAIENTELDALMFEDSYVLFKDEKLKPADHDATKGLSKEEKKLLRTVKKL